MGDFELYNRSHRVESSQAMDVSAKVMVVAIIVLFMIIVFVILLHLYAKWSWNRRAAAQGNLPTSNRLRRSRFVFAPNQVPVAVTSLFRGLEPSVIKSLPVVIFNSDEFKEGLECAVCLSELTQGEKARLLPKCNHGFHVECIDMWFQSHSTCPLCRNPIADDATSNPELSPLEHNPINGFSLETPNFPTNVLFWGDQTQVSTRGSPLEDEDEDEANSSSSSPSFTCTTTTPISRPNGDLVIEVPQRMIEGFSSMSPSTTSRFTEEDLKSPMTTRLRSFRRLLSRDKKIVPCSPNSIDLEQGEGGRGQSSKTASDSPNCYAVTTAADRVDDMSTQIMLRDAQVQLEACMHIC